MYELLRYSIKYDKCRKISTFMPCLALPTQRVKCTSVLCIDSRQSLVGVPVAMDLMTVSVNAC